MLSLSNAYDDTEQVCLVPFAFVSAVTESQD
jgi:hypothetical protein